MNWLWPLVFRDLRRLPPGRRTAVLEQARAIPMTAVERAGVVLAVGAVAVATRYLVGDAPGSRLEVFARSFVLALPLLTAGIGGCHAARLSRGVKSWRAGEGRSR